ncbi:alpha-galactosidase [Mycotypha africana]|uniref:alpha-galactosidase n=1 Tax=Mycotypha africana TaxID=64632 RepID=UPI0023000416|nr:alpha-galactosidase [Mycotypha africana]KAI8971654.1 alpha-galactosidase [Mycotypha africana]
MQILKPGIEKHLNEDNVWCITTQNTSYIIGVDKKTGVILNLYWGPRLATFADIDLPITVADERSSQDPAITSAAEEFPVFGGLRYGLDTLRVKFENGTREVDLRYYGFRQEGRQKLTLIMTDRKHQNLEVQLYYTLDVNNDLIIRHSAIVTTDSTESYYISKALTGAWHIPPPASNCNRELITLAGAWSAETQVQKHTLKSGTTHVLESTRGIPSAQCYPYFAIKDQNKDGEHADCEVYFGTLGWSGSWKIEIKTDIEGKVTVTGGMHNRDFSRSLKGVTFDLPVFVAGYTSEGLSGARRSLTNHIRDNKSEKLIANPKANMPVLYNGWEAYGFDINLENQKKIAKEAADLGAELFVLDDGWFSGRSSDHAGLGDWFADAQKFPNGLKPLVDYVHKLGLKFGLWFEPEMVNPDSNLYREHPDWVYHYPDRPRHQERNQLVLNICMPEVRKYLLDRIITLVNALGVDYIKWDMNRPISEAGSSFNESVWTEHVNAFHLMVMKVKLSCNLVQIETCCSGGGRADMSILRKVETCWPSDNTRPDARLIIQYGASFVIPPNSMSCWVTDMPNSDGYKMFPISYRFHVSFMGTLGIGSNLNSLTPTEKEEYKGWISLYKSLQHILQFGDLDWLVVPTSEPSSYTAVTQTNLTNGNEAVVLAFRQNNPFWLPLRPIRLRRLVNFATYEVKIWSNNPETPVFHGVKSGAVLMKQGLSLPYLTFNSYSSVVVHIEQKL